MHDALPLYQQMRLLFPRRAFPALRFGDAADAAGQNQVLLSLFLSGLSLSLISLSLFDLSLFWSIPLFDLSL